MQNFEKPNEQRSVTNHETHDIASEALNYLIDVFRSKNMYDFVVCAARIRSQAKKYDFFFRIFLKNIFDEHDVCSKKVSLMKFTKTYRDKSSKSDNWGRLILNND